MRIILDVTFPHAEFNAAVKDGTAGPKMQRILEAVKPEAVYFTTHNGHRGTVVIMELPDVSKLPSLAEPWFLTFNADVECRVAMTPADLQKAGLEALGKTWG